MGNQQDPQIRPPPVPSSHLRARSPDLVYRSDLPGSYLFEDQARAFSAPRAQLCPPIPPEPISPRPSRVFLKVEKDKEEDRPVNKFKRLPEPESQATVTASGRKSFVPAKLSNSKLLKSKQIVHSSQEQGQPAFRKRQMTPGQSSQNKGGKVKMGGKNVSSVIQEQEEGQDLDVPMQGNQHAAKDQARPAKPKFKSRGVNEFLKRMAETRQSQKRKKAETRQEVRASKPVYLEVNYGGEKPELIVVRKSDSAKGLAAQFAAKHEVGESEAAKLQATLQSLMKRARPK